MQDIKVGRNQEYREHFDINIDEKRNHKAKNTFWTREGKNWKMGKTVHAKVEC
jgi:hypothetical protein